MKKVILFTLFTFSISAQAGKYDDVCLEYGPIQKNKIPEVSLSIAKKVKSEKKLGFESIEKEFCGCMKVEMFNIYAQKYRYLGHSGKDAIQRATWNTDRDTYTMNEIEEYFKSAPDLISKCVNELNKMR